MDNNHKVRNNYAQVAQDAVSIGLVTLIAIAINLPATIPVDIDRKYLLGALAGIIALALIKYIRFTLVLTVITLIAGANAPVEMVNTFGFAPWILTVTLMLLVALGLVHRVLKQAPHWLDPKNDNHSVQNYFHSANAMFKAIGSGKIRAVRSLLRQGIDPNIRANGGETPLMYATAKNHDVIVQILLDNAADISLENNDGYTALMVAEIKGYDLIAALLKHAAANK